SGHSSLRVVTGPQPDEATPRIRDSTRRAGNVCEAWTTWTRSLVSMAELTEPCPNCGVRMRWETSHERCPGCGWIRPCCEGAPLTEPPQAGEYKTISGPLSTPPDRKEPPQS